MSGADSFDVVQTESDEDEEVVTSERVLGVVTMDAAGVLAIVSAVPDEDETLETIVEEMNAETTLHEEAPRPEGARQFEVFTRPIERGTAGFVPAMLEHLKRYFDIELRPRR